MRRWREKNAERLSSDAYVTKRRTQQRVRYRAVGAERHLKKNYGLTTVARDALLASQGGVCLICKTDDPGTNPGWSVDHCHTTGKVRGILCASCNWMLGHAKDNPGTLAAGIAYLKDHHGAD